MKFRVVEVVGDPQTAEARELKLLAENLNQTGGVNVYPAMRVEIALVLDESKLSELIHKKVDVRACSANHRCQSPLRYSRKSVKLALTPLPCEQQQSTGQAPLAALRNLVD